MRARFAIVGGVLALVAFGEGCGGSSGPATPEAFVAEFQQAVCQLAVRCKEEPDQATCLAAEPAPTPDMAALIADVKSGRVAYDRASAADCLNAVSTVSACTASALFPIKSCAATFVSSIPAGGACSFGDECASGTCQVLGCANACCPGTCAAVVPVGGDCSATDASCVAGAYCRTDAAGAHCAAQTTTVGGPCDTIAACAFPLWCVADATGAQTCQKLPATGERCDQTMICDSLLDTCDPSTAVCVPLGAVGAACADTSPGCQAEAVCDGATSTCVLRGKVGDSCTNVPCLGALACDGNAICNPLPNTGCPGS